jgi:hypothetical protein
MKEPRNALSANRLEQIFFNFLKRCRFSMLVLNKGLPKSKCLDPAKWPEHHTDGIELL